MGKQNFLKKKEYAKQSWQVLIFYFVFTKVSLSPGVNKTQIHSTTLPNGVRIPRLLGLFLQKAMFHKSPQDILVSILEYNK